MMQRAMPELVSTLESGFSLMAASMQAMNASHSAELQKLNKSWSEIFALGNSFFNSSSAIPFNSPINNTIDNTTTAPIAPSPTTYRLNRTIVTVTDVWREYADGLCGAPSVKRLEEEFGTAWRKDRKESRFFSRRNELYKAIKDKANRERISCDEAARRIEERRLALNISLDKLRSVIKDDNL